MEVVQFTWAEMTSPIGQLTVVASDLGVLTCQRLGADAFRTLDRLEADFDAPISASRGLAADAVDQLSAFFAGKRAQFDIPIDWQLVHGFARAALQAVCTIEPGTTASYGEVAILAGRPGAARAVGSACRRTPLSIIVPVHRVIRADGSLGGYGDHPEHRRLLLRLDGYRFPTAALTHKPTRADSYNG